MGLIIQDREPENNQSKLSVTARPSATPFYENSKLARLTYYATFLDGVNWTLTLPWPSESSPSNVTWSLVRSDDSVIAGTVPESIEGPVSAEDLVSTYGWGTIAPAVTPITIIAGPRGINWRGNWDSSTLYVPNDAVFLNGSSYIALHDNTNSPPPSSNWDHLAIGTFEVFLAAGDLLVGTGLRTGIILPISNNGKFLGTVLGTPSWLFLTPTDIPSLDASKLTTGVFSTGLIPNLDANKITTGILDLARLAGITHSQLDASAGILGSQIHDVPATLVSGLLSPSQGGTGVDSSSEISNVVFAGPASGMATAAFRSLVEDDIPDLDASVITTGVFSTGLIPNLAASIITSGQLALTRGGTGLDTSVVTDGQLLIGQTSDHTFGLATLTAGSNVTITNVGHAITIASSNPGGTVTSVAMTVPADFGISGSAITSSGTLGLTWNAQTGNVVMSSPSGGGSGTPTFRNLVANDIPNLDTGKITSGTLALARLSGITTAQLSNTAGIVSGQIASVAASTLTGSNTLPDGVLSTNVPLLNAPNVFTNNQSVSTIFGLLLPSLTFSGVNLVAGGSLTVGTPYYYVITALDPVGGETTKSGERTVTPTAGNQTASITWALDYRPCKIRIYRSIISGNYTNVSYFDVINSQASNISAFSDTGAITATGTGTPPSTSTAYYAKFNKDISFSNSVPGVFITTPYNSGAVGVALALGNGPFDGVSAGSFTGTNGGTLIGGNWFSNADFINFQIPITNATLVNDAASVGFRVVRTGGVVIGYRHAGATPAIKILLSHPTLSTLTTSTTGGTLPDNTTYYYTVAAVDGKGNTSIISNEKTVTTGNAGTNTNSTTLVWTHGSIQSVSSFFVYRSTISGSYNSVPSYQVMNTGAAGILTYTDTNASATTRSATTGLSPTGVVFVLNPYDGNQISLIAGGPAQNTRGTLNIGSGPFDGTSPGAFNGGTNLLSINLRNGDNVANVLQVQQAAAVGTTNVINGTVNNIFVLDTSGNMFLKNASQLRMYALSPSPNTPTTATSGGTLLDNTTYYYVVTTLDVLGGEGWISPTQSSVTTGNSGSNVNTNTVTWAAQTGAMGYMVYRSTISNNFTSSTRYKVVNATTFTDTGAAGTTATPPTANGGAAFVHRFGTNNSLYISATGNSGASRGVLNLGSGPFDNTTTGFFAGTANGTHLAINATSGSTSNLIDAQTAGVSAFVVPSISNTTNLTKIANATGVVFTGSLPAMTTISATTSTSGGTLLDNTTYYYEFAALDVLGNEGPPSAQISVTTGNSGGNTNSNTVTGSTVSVRGMMACRVYRSTTSGNFTSSKYFIILNTIGANAVLIDTGAAGTTGTPLTAAALPAAFGFRLDSTGASNGGQYFNWGVPGARHGSVNIGSGPFDNSTAGYFSGSTNGTELAINSITGFLGNFIDAQLLGVSKFKVTGTGNIAFAGVIVPGVLDAPNFASTLSLTVTAAEVHKVGSITGAMTINASAGGVAGQRMTIILPNDSSGTGWVVTFGTNLKTSGTLTGTSAKSATISFISDGTSFYETGRVTGATL